MKTHVVANYTFLVLRSTFSFPRNRVTGAPEPEDGAFRKQTMK
jgi:hypothetical protein